MLSRQEFHFFTDPRFTLLRVTTHLLQLLSVQPERCLLRLLVSLEMSASCSNTLQTAAFWRVPLILMWLCCFPPLPFIFVFLPAFSFPVIPRRCRGERPARLRSMRRKATLGQLSPAVVYAWNNSAQLPVELFQCISLTDKFKLLPSPF